MTEAVSLYPWLQAPWQRLMQLHQQQRLPHAQLITGQQGTGKLDLARHLGKTLLCKQPTEQGACHHCDACRLFEAGTHPDYYYLAPEDRDKAIKVDEIRELSRALALTSQYGGYKVAVMAMADNMNVNAANSLLKTLEEPVKDTLIILVSDRPFALPATIRSRCQVISIARPDETVAREWLESRGIPSPEQLLQLANGGPLLALQLADDNLVALRQDFLKAMNADRLSVSRTADTFAKAPAELMLHWFYDWVCDCINLRMQSGQGIINQDQSRQLQKLASGMQATALYSLLDLVLRYLQLKRHPLNQQMLWEDLLIHWQEARNSA